MDKIIPPAASGHPCTFASRTLAKAKHTQTLLLLSRDFVSDLFPLDTLVEAEGCAAGFVGVGADQELHGIEFFHYNST